MATAPPAKADPPTDPPAEDPTALAAAAAHALWTRRGILIYNLGVLAVLLVVWLGYVERWDFIRDLTSTEWIRVELHAVWFAVLGGVAISLKGITDHWRTREWPRGQWGLWYVSRPFNGIVVGSVAFVALQVANTSSPPSIATVAIASFILGMQDKRFYAFIASIGRVILTVPNDVSSELDVREVTASDGVAGATLLIVGGGMVKGTTVTVGGLPALELQVSDDGTVAAGKLPAGKGTVDVVVANPDGWSKTISGAIKYK
jgi:hypothetical protein